MQAKVAKANNTQGKYLFQVSIALIPIAFSIYFLKHNSHQLQQSIHLIYHARIEYIGLAFIVTLLYLSNLGMMYKSSFETLHSNVPYKDTLLLALKRNFISVFLPMGGITAYAFFTKDIEDKGVTKAKIYLSSVVFAISGIASLLLVAIPAFFFLAFFKELSSNFIIGLILIILIVGLLLFSFNSLYSKGVVYRLLNRFFPKAAFLFDELNNEQYSLKHLLKAIMFSFFVELCGITHLFLVSKALNIEIHLTTALICYVIATITYALSPFMRGVGAVEFTLVLALHGFNIQRVAAISISLFYRFFEFWLPLIISAGSFFYKKQNIVLRILPALFTLFLGIVNIISVLTPAATERLKLITDFLPTNVVYLSNFSVIIAGVILIILSAFLFRGFRNSWITAVIITSLSVIGHLTKAIDYEEASFALFVLLLLVYTRKNYFVKSDFRLFRTAKWYFGGFILFILVYGVLGFYLLSKKHFGFDLNLGHSFLYLLNSLLIFNNSALSAYTPFAMWFVHSLNFLGIVLIASSLYFLLKPKKHFFKNEPTDIDVAKTLVQKNGNSALDYFKTYSDKLIYLSRDKSSFISFKTASNYAIVLELPVCDNESKISEVIKEFDNYCLLNGLRTIYYRIDESQMKYFSDKNFLFIGQEGIVDLSVFTLEGGEKKPERNALNKVKNLGYKCKMYDPPQKDGFLQKLKSVSDEWLIGLNKKEATFSQGIWNAAEIKQQVVFAVENEEEKIVAFTNIIPDYSPDEGTYDLIRKTTDAPNGVLDVLMVNMIDYFRKQNKKYLNLGLTPFAGIDQANNFKERTIKMAYQRFRQFDHFKGLRFFKEKYATIWNNKYLVYESDFDLLQAPLLIEKVSKV